MIERYEPNTDVEILQIFGSFKFKEMKKVLVNLARSIIREVPKKFRGWKKSSREAVSVTNGTFHEKIEHFKHKK